MISCASSVVYVEQARVQTKKSVNTVRTWSINETRDIAVRFHPTHTPPPRTVKLFLKPTSFVKWPLSAERKRMMKDKRSASSSRYVPPFPSSIVLHHVHFLGPCSLHRGRGLTTSPLPPLRALTRSRSLDEEGAVGGVYSPPIKDNTIKWYS